MTTQPNQPTQPTQATQATSPADALPALVIRTDRRALARLYGLMLAMHVLILVALLAVFYLIAAIVQVPALLWLVGLLVALEVFQIGTTAYTWGTRAALDNPLTLAATGLTANMAQGTIVVPWSAITSVTQHQVMFARWLTFAIDPAAIPGEHGTFANVEAKHWTRILRAGLRLGGSGLNVPLTTVLDATAAFTGGRLPGADTR